MNAPATIGMSAVDRLNSEPRAPITPPMIV